jgi:drug/metabolite transporter (DMT)-like permease
VSDPDRVLQATSAADVQARLMLVVLSVIWGVTWPLMKIALDEIPPLSMRTGAAALGSLTLAAICRAKGRSLRIHTAKAWAHVAVAGLFNIVGFSLFSAFAQMATATSRVTILTYAMPVWTVLLAWAVLNERPTRMQQIAIVLCLGGLAILMEPVLRAGLPLGLFLSLATGISWAAGTIYLKWARIDADATTVASWQLTLGFLVIATSLFIFEGRPYFDRAHTPALLALAFTGIIGNGIAYGLWFAIVGRVSAATASLGVLSVPVIGVVASVLILGEHPTPADLVGFALILAASACALAARSAPAQVRA